MISLFGQVEMENMATKKKYLFVCGRWLADDEDDHQIIREISAEGETIKKPEPSKIMDYIEMLYKVSYS